MEENKSLIRQADHPIRSESMGFTSTVDAIEAEIIDVEPKPQSKWAYAVACLLLIFVTGAAVYLLIREEPVAGKIVNGPGQGQWVPINVKAGSAFNSIQGSFNDAVAQGSDGQSFVTADGGQTWVEQVLRKPIVSRADIGVIVVPWGGIGNGKRYIATTSVEGGSFGAIYLIQANGLPIKIWEGDYGQIVGGSRNGQWLVGTQGLVLQLRNGKWNPAKIATTGCGTPDLNAVATGTAEILAVGAEGKVVRSVDNGEHWSCEKLGPVREKRALFAVDLNNQWELVGGQGGALYIRRDKMWRGIPGLDKSLSIQSILIDGNTAFVAGGRQGYNDNPFILFSRDLGKNWEKERLGNNNLTGMVVGMVKLTNGFYAVTSDGQILKRQL